MNLKRISEIWRYCYGILFLSLFPFTMKAQSPTSLKDCIEYGLKNHTSRVVYSNEKLIAEAKAKEVRAGYLPSVNITAGVDDNLKVQESIIPAGMFGPEETRVAFTKKFASTGSVQLDQTIYDQSLITGMKAGKISRQQAELNLQLNDETIVYNICAAYYEIFVYREQIELLQENLKSYTEQLRISLLGLEKGVVIEADVNKLRVNYNNTKSQIITAESNLELSENRLKNAMGFPLEEQLSLNEPNANSSDNMFTAALGLGDFHAENRIDYKIAETDIALLEIEEKQIKNGAFPKLTDMVPTALAISWEKHSAL